MLVIRLPYRGSCQPRHQSVNSSRFYAQRRISRQCRATRCEQVLTLHHNHAPNLVRQPTLAGSMTANLQPLPSAKWTGHRNGADNVFGQGRRNCVPCYRYSRDVAAPAPMFATGYRPSHRRNSERHTCVCQSRTVCERCLRLPAVKLRERTRYGE